MIIPDVIEIVDKQTFKRPIYAGNAIATCKSKNKINIITIRATAFEEAETSNESVAEIKKIGSLTINNLTKKFGPITAKMFKVERFANLSFPTDDELAEMRKVLDTA